jgi:hypothetical protein
MCRPDMGPNLFITPPGSFTRFHQDGNGTVDSAHLCMSGFNEVIMLPRLTEEDVKKVFGILKIEEEGYVGMPHWETLVS